MFPLCKQNERWTGAPLALTEGWVRRCGEEKGRPETPDQLARAGWRKQDTRVNIAQSVGSPVWGRVSLSRISQASLAISPLARQAEPRFD